MFPSAALFAEIHCPFFGWGQCERPYCLYKHANEDHAGVSGHSVGSAAEGGHGSHSASDGAFHNEEESNTCLMELERINKQIEAVRSEVEKEQKRLSRYQSEQAESAGVGSEKYLKSRSALAKDQNGNQVKCKKTAAYPHSRKYVVDRTRPKTDLEYDPCSNFSADLRSGCSSDKMKSTNKADKEHDHKDKGAAKNVCPDLAKSSSCHFEDSDEEGMLVIDIPTVENERHPNKPQKPNMAANEDLTGLACNAVTSQTMKITPDSPGRTHLDADVPLVEKTKEKIWLGKNSMTSFNEHLESPEPFVINIPQQEDDGTRKAKHSRVQRKKLSSEGALSVRVGSTEDEQKGSVQSIVLPEECGSSETMIVMDCSRGSKQSLTIAKTDKAKEEISRELQTLTEHLQELHKGTKQTLTTDVESSEVFHTEKPMSANNVNLDCYDEKTQNVEDVLDNISICLDNLRSESEKLACFQNVEAVIQDTVFSAKDSKMVQDLSSQSVKMCVENVNIRRPEFDIQPNSSVQKDETYSSQAPQGTVVFQSYFPTMASYPTISKNPGSGPTTQTFVETWPAEQKILPEPVAQNMPVYISGPETVCVPPAQLANLLNASTTSVGCSQGQILQKPATSASSCVTYQIGSSSQTASPALMALANKITERGSSSSEELNYSDLDLSETDPMEECYNIFMEANKTEAPAVQGDMPEEVSKVPEAEVSVNPPPPAAQKKRVAHVSKFEQVTKTKAQVIVPLREGSSQLAAPNRSQQCQKRATALTAAVKGCQSFITANAPKRVLAPAVIHPSPVPNSYVNILPVGATLRLGSNLHLIVPEGNCALPVTLIPSTVPVTRPTHQPTLNPQPAQPANYTPAKSIPTKRKAKGRTETGVKVPHDVRQRYVNLFVEEFLKTSATVQEAFEKALAEEKTVFDRSINKLKYLSIAVNALKRLKNQNAAPAKFSNERDARASRGNVPLNTQALLGNGDTTLYGQFKEHVLTETLLRENSYPRKHPEQAGVAIQHGDTKKGISDAFRRICCRCGATFTVSQTGKHTRKDECNYHYGKVIENRVPGGVETRYSCCENAVGSPGCQLFKLHVHDAVSLQGFVSTVPQTRPCCPGVYAIDTEMCYTTQGLELVRVTVVNSSLQVIYDTFVKPNNEVIDYNTRFSGVSEVDIKGSSSSLRDVQAALLSFISEDTILVGHGLENDLCALKLFHSTVVDTSVVFPHRLGPPHKRELPSLTADYLRRIIQESVEGHDTREDAVACMELMLWKVKEDSKVKRW